MDGHDECEHLYSSGLALPSWGRVSSGGIITQPSFGAALLAMAKRGLEIEGSLPARLFLECYFRAIDLTTDALLFGVKVEQRLGDGVAAAEYRFRFEDLFPFSGEAQSLEK